MFFSCHGGFSVSFHNSPADPHNTSPSSLAAARLKGSFFHIFPVPISYDINTGYRHPKQENRYIKVGVPNCFMCTAHFSGTSEKS